MSRGINILVLLFLALFVTGCAYTTKSELPGNIKTIEVTTFGNTTYYNNLEGALTREIIRAINLTPGLKVVNSGADAVLSGSIFKVSNTGLAYDSNYQPTQMSTVISANFSLYDNKEGYFAINNRVVASNYDSSTAGIYNESKNEVYDNAEDKSLAVLAQTIVRSMVSHW